MIPTSDLRKGNLVKTEHGILPVHHIAFGDVQVKGTDGRILWANQVEGVEINEEILIGFGLEKNFRTFFDNESDFYITTNTGFFNVKSGGAMIRQVRFAHELQNLFYWIERKELSFNAQD